MTTGGREAAPAPVGDDAEQLANHPELKKLWDKYHDANGGE